MRSSLKAVVLIFSLALTANGEQLAPIELPSPELPGQARYDYYKALVTDFTGESGSDDLWVIGLRGINPKGQRYQSGLSAGGYTDTFVVLRPDKAEAVELKAATHGGQARDPVRPFGVPLLSAGEYVARPVGGPGRRDPVWQMSSPQGEIGRASCRERVCMFV